MARPLWGLLLWLMLSIPAEAIEFSHYHSQIEIDSYLLATARAHPDMAEFHTLGLSEQGRPVNYLVLSLGDPKSLPAIYLNGTHHGDEKASTETVLAVIDFLIANRGHKVTKDILTNYAVYLQPLVNPDGFALHSRFDARGSDPNRDYSYPGRSDDDAFKSPASRLVRRLTNRVRFRAALAFHSGMEGVLWAWAHTPEKALDHEAYLALAKATADAMGMERYLQSFKDYPSQGEFIDYVYSNHGTLALTIEVASEATPPARELQMVVKRAVAGSVAFMLNLLDLDRGQLRLDNPPRIAKAPWNWRLLKVPAAEQQLAAKVF